MSRADLSTVSVVEAAESLLAQEYIRRTKELRERRGMTQREMARALGISLDRYKKYEIRSPLPPYLVERFAGVVGVPIERVITGRARRSQQQPSAE